MQKATVSNSSLRRIEFARLPTDFCSSGPHPFLLHLFASPPPIRDGLKWRSEFRVAQFLQTFASFSFADHRGACPLNLLHPCIMAHALRPQNRAYHASVRRDRFCIADAASHPASPPVALLLLPNNVLEFPQVLIGLESGNQAKPVALFAARILAAVLARFSRCSLLARSARFSHSLAACNRQRCLRALSPSASPDRFRIRPSSSCLGAASLARGMRR